MQTAIEIIMCVVGVLGLLAAGVVVGALIFVLIGLSDFFDKWWG